jgi:alkanesulfonate monooxygenase SsuD/methylene tetrahydromethanopterin reductase-like flavin-dependent oxidoreductase (luciferase family)
MLVEATGVMDAIAHIREAEQAGVQQIWMGSGIADTLTLFAAAAAQTERIRLGTSIAVTYSRHPLVMARQALALDDIAPGRLRLGLGPGNRMLVEDWYGLSYTSPLPYLKEYLEIVRDALWEERTDYHGEFFQVSSDNLVAAAMARLSHKAPVPLLISAVSPKAFQLAGEISDGALSWANPVPYLLDQALPALRAGAEARSRPTPPLIAHVQVALTENEAAVLATARRSTQQYGRIGPFARMLVQAGFAGALDGDEAELDALTRARVISGNEETVRGRLQELLTSGLNELLLQLVPIADAGEERRRLLQLVGSL